jgi:Zn-dependent protease
VFGDLITPEKIVTLAVFLLIAFPVHEFAHAFVAYQLGDSTAKLFGRLTLNPIVHFDPIGGLFLIISALSPAGLLFGWAKPTPVNPANLRDRRNGELLVALAGPASNLVMAAIAAFVIRLLRSFDVAIPEFAGTVLILFMIYNVALMVFNLIPVPPLDGSAVLFRFLDPQTAWRLRPILSQYGFIILILFIFTIGQTILPGIIFGVANVLVGP